MSPNFSIRQLKSKRRLEIPMDNSKLIEKALKDYKFNKGRISFLKNQLDNITPETYNDYIEGTMFVPGYSGAVPKFISEAGREVCRLNKVEETSVNYKNDCSDMYIKAVNEIKKELSVLRFYTLIVEDSLAVLEKINPKYKIIIERYYVNSESMDNVAKMIHLSRSRCYNLCKDAVQYMARIVFGLARLDAV